MVILNKTLNHNKYKRLYPPSVIGIIGGGQLGKMITFEAKRMGYNVIVLDPSPCCSAGQVADEQVVASFGDFEAFEELARKSDVVTYEFEHINADILISLEDKGYKVYPSGRTLKIIQDKYIQKMALFNAGISVPEFVDVNNKTDVLNFSSCFGFPLVIKTRAGGYDGKGYAVAESEKEIEEVLNGFGNQRLIAERFIDFQKEISIIIARNPDKEYCFYPIAENVHKEGILRLTKAPCKLGEETEKKVLDIAKRVVEVLDDSGVFCIEMFLDKNDNVYVNEIAPRPHNSGHYTIEACVVSQFEQMVRIITGMPLGSTQQLYPCAMANILGNSDVQGEYTFEGLEHLLKQERVYLHLYGKKTTARLKKIGHLTALGNSPEDAEKKVLDGLNYIKIKAK